MLIWQCQRLAAPRRGVPSPPGQELLGVITSHGPSRESYTSSRKARDPAAVGPQTAAAPMSAQGMRGAISSPAGAPSLLQRGLPEGGAEMVAVEGATTIPGDDGGQRETERPERALSGASPAPETARAGSSWRRREGNHYRTFSSIIAVTDPAATRGSSASGEVPYSTSVRRPAGERWSASTSGSGVGKRRAT